jgi:deoxyribonucleoside regulator
MQIIAFLKKDIMATEDKFNRLVEIARAYYLENRTQAEIARTFGVNTSQISRYLKEARESGIVQIRIADPGEQPVELAESMRRHFPSLVDIIIAPIFTDEIEAARAIVGRYAANYLMEIVKPGDHLALGCGRTLRAMVNALQPREVKNVTVTQAMGNFGHEAHGIDYMEIAQGAANAFGAKLYYISAPAILGKGVTAQQMIDSNPTIQVAFEMAHQADICVFGVGSLESDQIYTRFELLEQAELDQLKSRAVGDICGRFFNCNGQEQVSTFSDRIIGISLEDIRRMKLRIAVANGTDKVAPLLGALRGEWINVLISDENTVRSIIALSDTLPTQG